jgi:hypothetical protein
VERANQWGITPDGRIVIIDYGQQDLTAAARSPKQLRLFLKEPPWGHHVSHNLLHRTDRGSWRPAAETLHVERIAAIGCCGRSVSYASP